MYSYPKLQWDFDSFLADGIVSSQMQSQQDYANTARLAASTAISALANFTIPDIPEGGDGDFTYNPTPVDLDTSGFAALQAQLSAALAGVDTNVPPLDLSGLNAITAALAAINSEIGTAPDFSGTFSQTTIPTTVLNYPTVPSTPVITLPTIADAPDIEYPDEPDLDDINIPSPYGVSIGRAPEIIDVAIPDIPDMNIPSFDGTAPDLSGLIPPTIAAIEYNNSGGENLKATLEAALDAAIADLTTNTDTIQDGAIARIVSELEERKEEISAKMAARGFAIPPGSLDAAYQKLDLEHQRNITNITGEIAKQKTDIAMNIANMQASSLIEMEKILVEQANTIAMGTFEASKATAEMTINLFQATIAKYQMAMELYKTEASVFRDRIEAEKTILQAYIARLEGAKVSAEIQEQKVDVWKAELEGEEIKSKIYVAQVSGAKVQADVNIATIEEYKARIGALEVTQKVYAASIEAYKAQVSAEISKAEIFNAEIKAYEANMNAEAKKIDVDMAKATLEEVKVKAYLGEVEAFKAESAAWSAKAAAISKTSDSQVAIGQAGIEAFKAQVEGYKALTDVKSASIMATGELVKAGSGIISAGYNVQGMNAQLQDSVQGRMFEAQKAEYESEMRNAEINKTLALESTKIAKDAAAAVAQVSGQLAASAMSGISVGAQVSGTQGSSVTKTQSESASESVKYEIPA